MITIDAPISFLVGSSLALASASYEMPSLVRERGYRVQTMILTPIIAFFMLRFPDWEWNYMFRADDFFFGEPKLLNLGILVVIISLLNLSYLAGFKLVRYWVEQNQLQKIKRMFAATALLIAGIMTYFWRETLYVGSIDQFNAGQGQLIFTQPDFVIAQAVAAILLTAGCLWALRAPERRRPA